MQYSQWNLFYKKIAQDLKLEHEHEKRAASFMNTLLEKKRKNLMHERNLKQLLTNKEIVVFGAGPSLEKTIMKNKKFINEKIKITADGATTALLKNKIQPDIIVTDLDGNISDQKKANDRGSKIIIHAHGDNMEKIKNYVPTFNEDILGTIQINPKPYKNLKNYGGFTDGDRAVFLSDHFQAKKIFLIGFDYNNQIGPYSFANKKNKKNKFKKLEWCKRLIEILQKEKKNIYYITAYFSH